jgi:NAD(P)-dependent dehydrogenase (short-subunit alcohol dehydrogenase family)
MRGSPAHDEASFSGLYRLFTLQGRTALVTGGTSGIGEMIARGLLIAGARVFITGRDAGVAAAKAAELSGYGQCEAMTGDVATQRGRDDLVAETAERVPSLSILVNNAGMTAHNPFGNYTEAQWDAVYGLNVKAPFFLVQALRSVLKANASPEQPSQVINVGSVAGFVSTTPDSYAYGGSKAALHHLTRVLARKLAGDGIRVNAVAPGLFPSKMSAWIVDDDALHRGALNNIPAGRLGHADDIAAVAIMIAASRYLTGDVIAVDGGLGL